MQIKLFVAIPSEFPADHCPAGIDLHYTGVGKVNAAHIATRFLQNFSPEQTIVLNYGSAGSGVLPIHTLVECKQFKQGDMNAHPLAPQYITPLDKDLHGIEEDEKIIFNKNSQLCVTADRFIEKPTEAVHDMEAYGIAKVCRILGFDFTAFKFISDSGEANDWINNHHLGIEMFRNILDELVRNNHSSSN